MMSCRPRIRLNLGIGFAIITGVVLRFQRDSIFAWSASYGWRPFEFSTRIDFNAPATLRKWPSVNKERVSASRGARPYMIIEGTLDECIQQFMLQPQAQHHLYEIHTAPQSDLVGAILSTDHSSSWRGSGIFSKNSKKTARSRRPRPPSASCGLSVRIAAKKPSSLALT